MHIPSVLALLLGPLAAAAGGGDHVAAVEPPRFGFQRNVLEFGVDCTGASDSTAGLRAAVTTVGGGGTTLSIPSGCVVRLGSPTSGTCANGSRRGMECTLDSTDEIDGCGAGATCPSCCLFTSVSLPSHIHIACADQSAGFAAVRHRCGGTATYVDAACGTDTGGLSGNGDCVAGSGTCAYDFGSTVYAPRPMATYTMLRDAGSQSRDIFIENCSFWTYQADPYQRCGGGTGGNLGLPCRQECSSGSILPGATCEADTDVQCTGGTCLRRSDCAATGSRNSCNGMPHSLAGPGRINPLDLARTLNARVVNVAIWDHFKGTFGIKTGDQATIRDTNVSRAITDCTTPLSSSPPTSPCSSGSPGNTGTCCYGALDYAPSNVQPTVDVADGIVTGINSQLVRVHGRGSTTGITSGDYSRLDECTIWPPSIRGPGTASGGYRVGTLGQVAKSQALYLSRSSVGVDLTGAGAAAIENRISGAFTTGIKLQAANSHATGNHVTGVTGTAYGIEARGNYDEIRGNYVEGDTAGAGIRATNAAVGIIIADNEVVSSAVDTMAYGIQIEGNNSNASITDNQLSRQRVAAVYNAASNTGVSILNNSISLSTAAPTTVLQPIHVLIPGLTQARIVANHFAGGWRGITHDGTMPILNLANTLVSGNRFQGLTGASLAMGGAGVAAHANYFNNANTYLSCDASCAGGSPATRGILCQQDSDCTAGGNACSPSVFGCAPEPAIFLGEPRAVGGGTAHFMLATNLFYQGNRGTKQCGGVAPTSPGARCTSTGAAGRCAGGGTCTGGSEPARTCVGGSEPEALCCTGVATCAVRQPTSVIRMLDYGTTSSNDDVNIVGNSIFSGTGLTDVTFLDFFGSASLGNAATNRVSIAGNLIDGFGAANTIGIKWPTSGTHTGWSIGSSNSFHGVAQPLVDWSPAYGHVDLGLATATTATSSPYADSTIDTALSQTYTVPANALYVGRRVHVSMTGRFSTTGTPTLRFRLYWGAVGSPKLCEGPAVTTGSSVTDNAWRLECDFTVRTVGASGTVATAGLQAIQTSFTGSSVQALGGGDATTIDTTAATALTSAAQWSTASASNMLTMVQFSVEFLN